MPNAEIVAIGSELLLGQIVDTNSAWMADRLMGLGVDLYYKTVVGDNPGRMEEVIGRALDRSDIVITGGGLGPTRDDLTREVIARVTGRPLVRDPDLLQEIHTRFRSRGLILTANNERQADIPQGAVPIHNPNGTAPAFLVEDPRGVVIALPGVPHELKWLFDHEVIPRLRQRFRLDHVIVYRVLKVSSMGESHVDHLIGHLITESTNPTVGVLAHPGQVDVRIAAKAPDRAEAAGLIAPVEGQVRKLLGRHVFAADRESMEDSVGELLRRAGLQIAVYEDITGGMVAERFQLADPDRLVEGIIAGGPDSARRLLEAVGAGASVSDPKLWTQELARALRTVCRADLGLAVHGIPDPEDQSRNLAKGESFFCVTDGRTMETRSFGMAGRGRPDRTRMSLYALDLVRMTLLEKTKKEERGKRKK
jgi:nicotinamide-nucleotide amidase